MEGTHDEGGARDADAVDEDRGHVEFCGGIGGGRKVVGVCGWGRVGALGWWRSGLRGRRKGEAR